MSNQLTPFEQYAHNEFDLEDVSEISDERALSEFGKMQHEFPDQYQEIKEQINVSSDMNELVDLIANGNPERFVMDMERVTIVEFKAFIDEALEEAAYKILGQAAEVDGSYQAKQARELRLSQ